MKRHFKLPILLLIILSLFFIEKTKAQEKIEQVKELPINKVHIDKELEAQITEIVKPVAEIIEKLLSEDGSGNYAAYKESINSIKDIKTAEEKTKRLLTIQKKFYPFFKDIWANVKIDENEYQQKIKNLFPDQVKETIQFTEFLNFTMGGESQKPIPPPPSPAPVPSNICVNGHDFFRGSFGMDGGAIGGSRVIVAKANPPSPAEIVTGADAAIIGTYRAQGWIRNTANVPTNFPIDNKSIRIKKTFDWNGDAIAFSLLGLSWATTAYSTNGNSTDFNNGGEIYTAVAPITFICPFNKRISKTEEELVSKTDITSLQFGITCFVDVTSSVYLSYAHAGSSCALMKWELCEE